jgi:signal transduction histidine kinase/DNA-binding response OmpR family regulator
MTDATKVNILVVDDLPEKLLVFRSILEELNENVVTALSGREALRHTLEREFAVILLDVNMPDMDGFETAEMIRTRKRSAHTPIIFVTGFADEMHTARGYSLGAVDYILAPVVPEILRTKVRVFVDLFRMAQQVKEQAEQRVALAEEQAARAAAEAANRRLAFLAEASKALTSSLDVAATLRGLPQVVVPHLADLAAVTVLEEGGHPWLSELSWVYPPEVTHHRCSLASSEAPKDELRDAVDRVLSTGTVVRLDDLSVPYPPSNNGTPAPSGEHRIRTAIILPLLARGRTLGALSLAMGCSGRRYGPDEVSLAEDLAGRAAIALDNARLYRNIQEADQRKNEFLAMLAHELRNPLAPIRNALHILKLPGAQAQVTSAARDMMERQVSHMTRLIDDLLDVSRITRGKILLRKEVLDLTRLVRGTAEDHRGHLENAGLTLEMRLPETPLWVRADPTRLAQSVGNILHNAAKFTDTGGHVSVTLKADGTGSSALLSVRDTGIGMGPDILGRVFEPFSQADQSLDRSRGGLGIGLALVKGLVEMHGGEVRAASAGVGHGSEFTLCVPLERPPEAALKPAAGAAASCKHCRVLVVEDGPDAAESLRILLSLLGHEVEVATTGPLGLKAARRFRPEVVVCDIGLAGGMDGYAVARALRQDPDLSGAHLIALTGYSREEDQQRAVASGFDLHLAKPVDPKHLAEILAKLPARAGK